jgi:uncharacterized membrane protein
MKSFYRVIRGHIVTGFIFVLPLLITISVISKYWKQLIAVGAKLSKLFFLDTVLGSAGDAVMAILLMLFICVVAGFLVKLTIFKSLSDRIDAWLGTLIPSYNSMKGDTLKKLGTINDEPVVYQTCLVKRAGLWQPAYLVESKEDGSVVAFVPNAPKPDTGQVVLANTNEWKPAEMDSLTLNNILKKMGKGL